MRFRRLGVTILTFCALGIAADPFVGTWIMNPAKTTYEGIPKPQSITVIIEQREDGLQFNLNRVQADGTTTKGSSKAIFDGKDHPLDGKNVDAKSDRRLDPHHIETTMKKNGKVTAHGTYAVSSDGKELTFTINGTNADGSPYKAVVVYERQ